MIVHPRGWRESAVEEYAVLCHGWMPPRDAVACRVCTLQGGRSDQSTVAAAGRVARSSCFANIGGLLVALNAETVWKDSDCPIAIYLNSVIGLGPSIALLHVQGLKTLSYCALGTSALCLVAVQLVTGRMHQIRYLQAKYFV